MRCEEMANLEHEAILRQGVKEWNRWREENPRIQPDLSETDLSETDLSEADLSRANLSEADLIGAVIIKVNFTEAYLNGALLRGLNFFGVNLSGATLNRADFGGADLSGADLSRANLSGANLASVSTQMTNFSNATFTGACIDNWRYSERTILDNIVCQYIYLTCEYIDNLNTEGKDNKDFKFSNRRPSNLSKTFAPREFSERLKTSLKPFELADFHQQDKNKHLIEIRKEFRSAFKQYLTYFEEFVRKAKEEEISFEVHTATNGLEILIDSDNEEETVKIVKYLKENVSLITQNIDNLNIEVEPGVSSLQAETLIVDLRHQIRHLQGSLDNARLEIKYQEREICNLKTQVEQYYTLLLETKTKDYFFQQNQNFYQQQEQQQENKMNNDQSPNNVNQSIANTGKMGNVIASAGDVNINQIQDPQLKELLEQLKSAINSSELEEQDKTDALEEVAAIVEAEKKQDSNAIQKAGRRFKRIISGVPIVTKGVENINNLWTQIQDFLSSILQNPPST